MAGKEEDEIIEISTDHVRKFLAHVEGAGVSPLKGLMRYEGKLYDDEVEDEVAHFYLDLRRDESFTSDILVGTVLDLELRINCGMGATDKVQDIMNGVLLEQNEKDGNCTSVFSFNGILFAISEEGSTLSKEFSYLNGVTKTKVNKAGYTEHPVYLHVVKT